MKMGDFGSPFFVGVLMIKPCIFKFCGAHFLSIWLFLGFIGDKQLHSVSIQVSRELKQIAFILALGYLFILKIKSVYDQSCY